MKPDVDRVLEVAAVQLMSEIGPTHPASYQGATLTSMGVLLLATREEFERGAWRRVEENAALRGIFSEAVALLEEAPLRERLVAAAETRDDDLHISALEATNAELRGLLIELHAHVEELDTPAAARLDEAIWSELVASTERRKLSFSFF